MDLILLLGIAVALLVILVTLFFFTKGKGSQESDHPRVENEAQAAPRRAQIVRNQRNRARVAAAPAEEQHHAAADGGSDEDEIPHADFNGEKMGAKKRAKLEAKAEKKALREQELKIREDQKKKDALLEEQRKVEAEKEAEEERKREEAEKKAREEKARQEHEEYLRMKEAFSVEEEGFDQEQEDDKQNMLQEFINFVKSNKVVVLEDLAVQFKLKTQAAIDRIVELQKDGRLSGVIDDRGKFIYISEEELNAVAKFIKQRGRVSITELAENSNNLINLVPVSAE
ncbi:DDRGK domain-containing protein 1 [Culex quinquefasciatus]|uniref:DDRGK domain-containing protein 1 n=1 Tax=Culex quinquefasciatus TaxID=7176 RepID=UPI0018E2CB55|nr:DDRGK domain-containing protein 1 [Culex quinquefasciatus]